MNRKEGYYWVKIKGVWIIAKYIESTSKWDVPKYAFFRYDDDFDEINETQILPPNN